MAFINGKKLAKLEEDARALRGARNSLAQLQERLDEKSDLYDAVTEKNKELKAENAKARTLVGTARMALITLAEDLNDLLEGRNKADGGPEEPESPGLGETFGAGESKTSEVSAPH